MIIYLKIICNFVRNKNMGVMTCSRIGCEEIMCDTYVDTIRYICSECKSEFEHQYGGKLSEREIYQKLRVFMDTEKEYGHTSEIEVHVHEFFNKHTQ